MQKTNTLEKYMKYKNKYMRQRNISSSVENNNNITLSFIPEAPQGNAGETVDNLVEILFAHYIKIKMLHFQTKSYATHKNTDGYVGTFLGNFDRLIECLLGLDYELNTANIELHIDLLKDCSEALRDELNHIGDELVKHLEPLFGENPEIRAIVDEMLIDANKSRYLAHLKR